MANNMTCQLQDQALPAGSLSGPRPQLDPTVVAQSPVFDPRGNGLKLYQACTQNNQAPMVCSPESFRPQ